MSRSPADVSEPAAGSIWSRQFVCSALVNFCAAANFFMLVPITVLLTAERYDASLGLGGLVAGALLAGGVASRPFAGLIMAGRSARKILLVTTTAMTVSTALCLLPVDLATFTTLRFVSGFAFGLGSTATLTTAVAAIPSGRRGEGTGWFGLSNSLAGAIGPAAGLFLAAQFSYDAVLVTVSVCAGLGTLAALALPRRLIGEEPSTTPPLGGMLRFFEPRMLPLCAVVACIGVAYSGLFSFMDPWTVELSLTSWAPGFFVGYSAMVVTVRPLTGRMMDRRGATVVIVPALFVLALGMVLVSTMRGPVGVITAGVVCGVGMGVFLCGATVLTVGLAPPGRMPVTASTFYLFLDAGVAFGPILLGAVIPSLGYPGLFRWLAVLVLLGTAGLVFIDRRGLLAPATNPSSNE